MSAKAKKIYQKIDTTFVDEVCTKLRNNKKVHRQLQGGGLLHIDRQLPFLTLYRADEYGESSAKLIKGEASYFVIPSSIPKARIAVLLKNIIKVMQEAYGNFLLLEVWEDVSLDEKYNESDPLAPLLEIYADTSGRLVSTCERLRDALVKIKIQRKQARVGINYNRKTRPKGRPPIFSKKVLVDLKCFSIGLGVKPVYLDPNTAELYPLIFRKYHTAFSHALKHAFFEFSHSIAGDFPIHYHALGANAVTKLAYKIDHQLANLSAQVDFLLWVTPVNTEEAWSNFRKDKYERVPRLKYRPVPIDPAKFKKQLYGIEIHKINDPTIQEIFEDKRNELDRMLTMLYERNTPNFVLGSMQLYGRVEDSLFALSEQILDTFSGKISDDTFTGKHTARDFANLANAELKRLFNKKHKHMPKVVVTDEVSGLMVNKGNLMVGKSVRVPNTRAQALLQHEVGTHIVSFANGANQSLQLFSFGLPGYDELQEGLAVFAEYLVGQLSVPRLKLLAGRVVAAHMLERGAKLKEIFQCLVEAYSFEPKTAFRIAIRIVRGGGLTKDAIYLRGFNQVIRYVQAGGDFELLFVGKFAQTHVPVVQELMHRGILKPAQILPSYLTDKRAIRRLEYARQNVSIIDLIEYQYDKKSKKRRRKVYQD